ncbi:serine/threonine protein kinase [[Kitasatospora] papulosa]|uniref:serine/threonine protein kinase n=1 Tax=Streptomyces TaxID=1883 RepID=UPI00215A3BF8|nr:MULTISPECIES: serine/threonine protein kinase [Streptomyces]MDF9873560.1 hypothetical protein [Streptomyces pratensis]MCX4413536.1 serine/threonine protein kinase [[Kitasatospora] papulosa]MDF6061360.1 serine/threonine protein kinase [Streptomyces sp. JH010]MDX3184479.1 serine/threonine protein kinase [Streptomyces sp. ME02-7008A-1]MDX3305170.1 serine/threonine protein kinase [Streptomyces sp. ME02-7008A]
MAQVTTGIRLEAGIEQVKGISNFPASQRIGPHMLGLRSNTRQHKGREYKMNRTTGRIAVTTSAAALFSTVLLGSPAQAASLSSEAASICGSGYYVQRSHVLSDKETQGATAFQLYNASSKKNCAVTLKHPTSSSFYGGKTTLGAGLRAEGGSWVKDEGAYGYYAGPVYISAAGKCVQFWGKTYQSGASSVWYETHTSALGNCG